MPSVLLQTTNQKRRTSNMRTAVSILFLAVSCSALDLSWSLPQRYCNARYEVQFYSSTNIVLSQQVIHDRLSWWLSVYPVLTNSNIRFNIYDALLITPDLLEPMTNWAVYATTPASTNRLRIPASGKRMFFAVRTRDTITGQLSDWSK